MTPQWRAEPIETDLSRAAAKTGADRLVPCVFTDLETVEPIWRELESRAVTTPYQRYDWIAAIREARRRAERWDGADLRAFEGSYGDYVAAKVAKVFPTLHRAVT